MGEPAIQEALKVESIFSKDEQVIKTYLKRPVIITFSVGCDNRSF